MNQTWFVAVVLVCLVAIFIFVYAARKRHGQTPDEMKKPKAIRRGKHLNE